MITRLYSFFTIVVGIAFIGVGLVMGFDAIKTILEPDATVLVSGIERNDRETKALFFVFPIILLVVGIVLCRLKYDYWQTKLQGAREVIRSFFQ